MSETVFLIFWICMTAILTGSAVLFLLFCRKCGMFEDADRCRHLALWAHTPSSAIMRGSPEGELDSSKFDVKNP